MPSDASPPCLVVCTTCRAGRPLAEGETPPGQHLHDAVAAALAAWDGPPPLELRGAKCLAACERGCTAAMAAPGKWSYLLGHLDAALAPDLLRYAEAYAAHRTGAVLPSRRPESLRRAVLGRIPSFLPEQDIPA
ncbi:DUF1636 family protein [Teichococcus oryzae]|uniref:DUF1636 domain-containing protein n=1 Tax=Teichococcus oryzae TaxID=1608942 RepID=A0A5B2TDD8_9PROT|nr:DUF1636 domain-containing protein [Pseudoroseomonas oryzae]KAA2211810.1 DUF1636 domain-containing protein [Pseudoroseomonas oryzae]